jgi:hypothetical protein
MRGVVLCSEAAFSIDIWFLYIVYRVSLHKFQTSKLEFSCYCLDKAKTNFATAAWDNYLLLSKSFYSHLYSLLPRKLSS